MYFDLNKGGVFRFKLSGGSCNVEEDRFFQIPFVIVKLEETGASHDGIDDVDVRTCRQGRAPLAAAYSAVLFDK